MLSDFNFSDLAISHTPETSRFKIHPGDMRLEKIPEYLYSDVEQLKVKFSAMKSTKFRATLDGDIKLRVQRRDTPDGPVFIARRISGALLPLDRLGIAPAVLARLKSPMLRSGLVLFTGGPGAGKTTAACSLLVERLNTIGGFTWTAENPVEYDLSGEYDLGQCYQVEIDSDSEVKNVLMDTLRSSADTFYIGEIREDVGAKSAALASSSGMLVIATLHSDGPQQALIKLGMLSGYETVAQSLRAIISMKMDIRPSSSGPRRILSIVPFFVEDDAIRMKIQRGDMASINSDIELQKNKLLSTPTGRL